MRRSYRQSPDGKCSSDYWSFRRYLRRAGLQCCRWHKRDRCSHVREDRAENVHAGPPPLARIVEYGVIGHLSQLARPGFIKVVIVERLTRFFWYAYVRTACTDF